MLDQGRSWETGMNMFLCFMWQTELDPSLTAALSLRFVQQIIRASASWESRSPYRVVPFAGGGQRAEGFQQRPAQRPAAGGGHHRLPEAEAGGRPGRSRLMKDKNISI